MGQNSLISPFLKWAGGKRQLVPEILNNYLPEIKKSHTYYEPFLGGGALLFALQPAKAVVSDLNLELINCYEVIRDSVEELILALSQHKNERNYYYTVREWDRNEEYKHKTPIERASRIIFLNKTCYNGLFRVNLQGQFNVPFGRYKNPKFLDIEVLRAAHHYLNQAQITLLNKDFQATVSSARKNDFIYFDPPYDPVSDTSSFTGYHLSGFDRSEQIRLKQTFDELHKKGCKVLLSNARTDFILDLYNQYRIVTVTAKRAINSNIQKRGKVDEVLVMNYEPRSRKN